MTTTNDQLTNLINDYWRIRMVIQPLEKIANNPACGKPGRGFKAARKAKQALARWNTPFMAARSAINQWITRNGKASADERAKRSARVLAELPEYATDWSE